jgi:hypothetical protein
MTLPAPHSLSASNLRKSLLSLSEKYVNAKSLHDSVYRSLGKTPTVVFRSYPEEGKTHHGNFHPGSCRQLTENQEWPVRLNNPHSHKSRSFEPADQVTIEKHLKCRREQKQIRLLPTVSEPGVL